MEYGCSAHWLNLLGQDVTPSKVIEQIIQVNKYFRNHHVPGALLAEHKGNVKPQLPCETRWNSSLSCIESFIINRPFLLLVATQNENEIEQRIRNIIYKVHVFSEAKILFEQLKLVSGALNRLQEDKATIADALDVWADLVSDEKLSHYVKQVNKRFNEAMKPCHYLANLLHPVYRGKKLKPE